MLHRGIAATVLQLSADKESTAVYAADPGRIIAWGELFSQFPRVPDVIDEGATEPLPGYGAITDEEAERVASALGRSAHARLHDAVMRPGATPVNPGRLLMLLGTAEASYDARLHDLRETARAGDLPAATAIFLELVHDVEKLDPVLEGAGLLPVADRRMGNLGLRCSDLARRHAMLLAGTVLVMRRLSTGPGEAGMRRIAGNRTTLRRYDTAQWQGGLPLSALPEGEDQVVVGEIAEMGWVDRPLIPYSFLRLTDGSELRIHRRDIKQSGTVPGALVWIRGKVELDDNGEKVLVAHFEGPGSHADTVWEDWLADEARHAYDLYPRVIDGNWEFPSIGVQYSAGDLISRLQEA
ncbi:hypothetical protein [Synechococcus sp. CS-205]|uniref:hypothetical protein n=1 Tax=Synechococcus sp. CS-205 TaxID=2847984 RepID=UPI00223BF14D|nr:hypothetical protein [Synechococcus sp. CS-205]MCT0248122.1 hypothetical protein [Synechococcus sp. CS-205]